MKRLLLTTLALSLSLGAITASAADDKVKQAARARYKEGVEQAKHNDWEGGYLSFKQAYSVIQIPDVLFNLAVCELKTNRSLDALLHFRTYLSEPGLSAKDRATAEGYVATLEGQTARIRPKVGAGADVTIDGKRVDLHGGTAIDVSVGKHDVSAAYPDGNAKRTSVELKPGENAEVDLLPPVVKVPQAASASQPPTVPSPTSPNLAPVTSNPPPIPPTVASSSSTKYVVAGTFAGLGVVSLVSGFAFGAISSSKHDDLVAQGASHPCFVSASAACASFDDLRSSQNAMHTASIATFIAAPVLIGAGAVTLLVWPRSGTKQAGLRVSPVVGLGSVQLVGTF